jgi:predicted methyltransferase
MEIKHFCSWKFGSFLTHPMRKYLHDPERILGGYFRPGMTAIDYGSGIGYFSLPMAKLVGDQGTVYCFDKQEKMLEKLVCKSKKAGFEKIIEPRLISNDERSYYQLKGIADFVLLFAVAHKEPDREKLFSLLFGFMKPMSFLLFVEPTGPVSRLDFETSILFAEKAGFTRLFPLKIRKCHSILLEKN